MDLIPIFTSLIVIFGFKSAAEVLKSIITDRKKRLKLTPGIIIVVHTFGKDLKS
ncbi:hypothetical protein DCCM_3286 [Desulfocucumis palustris]|uniref:Uncharacterized protein n=1 Tax=Desulfocucumis palustris TaxID=1898651 RepID=A0A2L2XDS3_9FIRM|nr:hypothetical protein DCCM_3286 [Desulfocucumis palustris]